jgi:hypothetical protein
MWTPSASPTGPIEYTPDPPWDGGAACAGGFTPGARALADLVKDRFPVVIRAEGYVCRQNTAQPSRVSAHGTGRAVDFVVPRGDRRADEVADWLVANAAELGVQVIIWDRTIWSVAGNPRGSHRAYTGPSSHTDHLHVEINERFAARSSPARIQEDSSSTTGLMLASGYLIVLGSFAMWYANRRLR